MKTVYVQNIPIGAGNPLVLIGGPCVIEEESLMIDTAGKITEITSRLGIPFIFKSSYLKDNRSKSTTYQGPGLENGLKVLQKIKETFNIPVISDIHNEFEAAPAAEVLDILQIPAYLCMQTTLALAAGKTGKVINVKKGQFIHPSDMNNVIEKLKTVGNANILLTERGSCFGYRNLVVDIRSLHIMRKLGYPVVFDPTHSLRNYGIPSSDPKGGSPEFIPPLSRAGIAAGVDAVFIETHPDVCNAECDAASMLPLNNLEELLSQLIQIDRMVKTFTR